MQNNLSSTIFVPQKLSEQLKLTNQNLDHIQEQSLLLFQQFQVLENTSLKQHAILTLMDTLLFYKSTHPIFNKLFITLITLMNQILDPQLSFQDIKQWSQLVISIISVIQRLINNYLLVGQKRDSNTQALKLKINSSKYDNQKYCLQLQNEKLEKWQLYETNSFIQKHFDTKKIDPNFLKTSIKKLEEEENQLNLEIEKLNDAYQFLSIDFLEYQRKLLRSLNEIFKIISKLNSELQDERLYEFIQDQKIEFWRTYAPEYRDLADDCKSTYFSMLGTIERLQMSVQNNEEHMKFWIEVLKSIKGQKQLLNEIKSIMLYSLQQFPQESAAVLSHLDKAVLYQLNKLAQ
ncbi:unnamed protein product (macronuclear) [Paramecium tetraurelia]|uniref:Dynein heavy chain tail domain-containing protein n=1 Tax=Paramecium tetraurelia TaxID=5888 RepID=A0CAG7_PARTE|nr:uncharacterized protein GSPATT00036564001 [Paramecium tetraurelia]CAK67784.1 unnamed protein product [Paramecium tetraurelia]|eukprot:XP_001435181.1 hypothetical protein (macronuclear) [Paramecium tetraurelia strain d4-2]